MRDRVAPPIQISRSLSSFEAAVRPEPRSEAAAAVSA
jgi:hypothetical protein